MDNKSDFIDVYVLKTLNEIKGIVKRNVQLEKEREQEIDKKMFIILKDLINTNFKNLQMDSKGNMIYTFQSIVDAKEKEKVRLSLVLYYTALYYDNVDLLHDLLKEDVRFNYGQCIIIQCLDQDISSRFERNKYIEMNKKCGYIFRNFSKSIEGLSGDEREFYIKRFVKLINMKYDLICEEIKENAWRSSRGSVKVFEDIFNKVCLDIFTDETYEVATRKQLELINHYHGKGYTKETCDRLNNLMQKKNFSTYLSEFDLMMRLFDDEQIEMLDYNMSRAIDIFSKTENGLNKIIDFLEKRPDLAYEVTNIPQEKFMNIDNFTLIELCDNYNIYELRREEVDFYLRIKAMKVKSMMKRLVGAYNKSDNQELKGLKLVKKQNH